MKISELFDGIRYVGRAEGDKKTYYVFDGTNGYLVIAPTETGYYMSVVDREVPDVVTHKFKGTSLTAKQLRSRARRPELFSGDFGPLNALYVMVALGRARKLKRRAGKAMIFKIV